MFYRVTYKQGLERNGLITWDTTRYTMRVDGRDVVDAEANFYKVRWIDGDRFNRMQVLSIRRDVE